ncbi:MAG: type II secretion system F family protein [Bacillota bacterium]
MTPSLLGVLAGAVVFLALGPGAMPGRPTPLTRLYARLGATPQAKGDVAAGAPWVRKMPVRPLVLLLRALMPGSYRENVERLLRVSRLERTHRYEDILAMKITYMGIVWFYLGLMLLKKPDPVLAVFLGLMGVPAFVYPDMWLKGKAQRRQDQVRRELPAFLSALAVALEAGLHLMSAIGEVSRNRAGILGEELREAVELTERGMGAAEALEAVTTEIEVPELTMVLTGLLQAFTKGSSHVVDTVRKQASEAWLHRKRRAEQFAQTASVRLFLPIALLALPGFMVFMLGPAVLEVIGYFIK